MGALFAQTFDRSQPIYVDLRQFTSICIDLRQFMSMDRGGLTTLEYPGVPLAAAYIYIYIWQLLICRWMQCLVVGGTWCQVVEPDRSAATFACGRPGHDSQDPISVVQGPGRGRPDFCFGFVRQPNPYILYWKENFLYYGNIFCTGKRISCTTGINSVLEREFLVLR